MWKAFIWPKITTLNRMLPLAPSANLHSECWVRIPQLHNSQWLYTHTQIFFYLNLTNIWTKIVLWLLLIAFLRSVQFGHNAQFLRCSFTASVDGWTRAFDLRGGHACALWPSCKWTLTELTACYRRKASHIFCGLSEQWRRIKKTIKGRGKVVFPSLYNMWRSKQSYSPSCCSECMWISFFSRTQK